MKVLALLEKDAVNVPLMLFTGTLRVRVLEARGLRPTEWSRRFNQNEKNETAAIDAYVNVDWDEYHVGKTLVRPKTNEPRWNEEFIANDVHSGRAIGFTVFHNCVMPPDDFVANTRIPFDDLKIGSCNDIWVDLEPHGQLHVVIELHGSAVEGESPRRPASSSILILSIVFVLFSRKSIAAGGLCVGCASVECLAN
ncbi:hypothetical protein Y032_0205g1913 [Ancylostoma ceylanicum]|nr:hypothetical protein Y032_0205g1913 [Ancylostoma ceylanicum]